MATPLLRKAYTINQEINDRVISYPLKYEKRTNKWKFNCENRNSRVFRTHELIYMFQGISTILLGVTLLYCVAYLRGILKTFQVLVGSLLFLTTFNGFVMDFIVVLYGNDMAVCINATFELAIIWAVQPKELTSKRKRDVNGIIALNVVLGTTLTGVFVPILIVVNNLDPVYTLIFVAQNITSFRILKTIDLSCWMLIVVRCTLGAISTLVVLAGIRTTVLVNLGTYPLMINLLQKFRYLKLDKTSLKFYLQACILYNATKHIFKIVTISLLSSVFFVIVVGANGTILLASLRKHALSMLCGLYTMLMILGVTTLFNISDKIYSESMKLLLKWEKEALCMKSFHGLFIKKTVKSFQPMAIPMGTVGIVDKNTKNAYLEEVLNYILNVLVMVNES